MYYVYVIQNKRSEKTYIGYTAHLKKRLLRHNNILPNKKTSYTSKNKGKWKVVYKERYNIKQDAIKREKELKSYRGRQYIKKIITGR